jgi:hypothetical protein
LHDINPVVRDVRAGGQRRRRLLWWKSSLGEDADAEDAIS